MPWSAATRASLLRCNVYILGQRRIKGVHAETFWLHASRGVPNLDHDGPKVVAQKTKGSNERNKLGAAGGRERRSGGIMDW